MSLTINLQPAVVDFSKNHPTYVVQSDASPLKIVARIFIKESTGAASYTQLNDIYLDPNDSGSVSIDVGPILSAFFETIQDSLYNIDDVLEDDYSLKKYYVDFYEVDSSGIDGTTQETSVVRYILYGRLDGWHYDHSFFSDLQTSKDYLTNLGTKIKTWKDAKQYLYWLNHVSGSNNFEVQVTQYYTDGTYYDHNVFVTTSFSQYDVLIIPTGYNQLGLSDKSEDALCYRYDVEVQEADGDTREGKSISYYVHPRPWNAQQLLFRNNYGVLESVLAEGKEELQGEAEIMTSRLRTNYAYGPEDFGYVQKINSRRKVYTAHIGPLTTDEAEHLFEMLNDKLYKITDERLEPCILLSKNLKLYNQDEDLQTIELKYQYAKEL
jgi:hypothetical protein